MRGQRPDPIPERFVAVDQFYDCQACIRWHGEKLDFPELGPENAPAWSVYLQLQDQQRFGGMGDAMGLDLQVFNDFTCRMLGIPEEDQSELFQKLIVINAAVNKHREQKREEEKAKREAEEKFRKMERGH